MGEIKTAAPEEQPEDKNNKSIISQSSMECLIQVAEVFGGEVTFLKLRGYSNSNKEKDPVKRYSAAKVPIDKDWTSPEFDSHTLPDLAQWIDRGGWIGLRVPADHIVVDVDNANEGRIISELLQLHNFNHHVLKTPNGYQFIFKDAGLNNKQNAKVFTECGFEVDYRIQNKGQIVIPTPNTPGRQWLKIEQHELDAMPYWFTPIYQLSDSKLRPFSVPIGEGSRNTTLFQHACRIKKMARTEEQIFKVIDFIGTHLCLPPVDDADKIVQSAMKYNDNVIERSTTLKVSDNVINHPAVANRNIPAAKERFNNTDLGNARRLVYYFGKDLRYCYAFGTWYIWDGKRWSADETGEIERKSKQTVLNIYKEALEEEDDKRAALMKHAMQSESRQRISNMISLAQSEEKIPVKTEQLDGDQWKINCMNGVIDLKTGELVPHNRDELMTNLVATEYDPNAECPNWMKFLNRIMQDNDGNERPALVEFLQRAVGYAFTGSIKEQVMFVLYGSGKNGKSTFINVVKDLLGEYARQSSTETFMAKQHTGGMTNDLARLKGARLVSAVESEEGKRLAESLIKQLTGGEPITARFLHKEFFEFTPTFKIFFVTNHKPQIRNSDLGIWRRIRLIPFTVTIRNDEDDKSLPEKLRSEMPGILKWAVEGCMMWQKNGLQSPSEITTATDEYRDEMDTMSHFVKEYCIINPLAQVATKDLYEAYKEWCDDGNERPLTKNKFITKLRERMESGGKPIKELRTSKMRGWEGIGLAAETNLPDMNDTDDAQKGIIKVFNANKENTKNSVTNVITEGILQAAAGDSHHRAIEEGEL